MVTDCYVLTSCLFSYWPPIENGTKTSSCSSAYLRQPLHETWFNGEIGGAELTVVLSDLRSLFQSVILWFLDLLLTLSTIQTLLFTLSP